MILHLTSELIHDIANESSDKKSLFNEFLEKLNMAFKEGKHIIYINKKDVHILKSYEWILEENKKYLSSIDIFRNRMYQSLDNLLSKIEPSDIIKITYDTFEEENNGNINFRYIPFDEFLDTEAFQKITIVSEHIENDGIIYREFFPEVYRRYKQLVFPYYLKGEMGGGSTIFSILKERCRENISGFYIFISDSDKKSPLKSGNGTTAKKLLKTYNECKRRNKNFLKYKVYVLEVKELENLIPLIFLKEDCEEFYEKYNILIEKDIRVIEFMDIKKGIKCYEEYKNITDINICEIESCNNKNNFFCKLLKDCNLNFFNEDKCEKLLENFRDRFLSNIGELVDIILNKCEYEIIKHNWIELGRIIYSWSVGSGKGNLHI